MVNKQENTVRAQVFISGRVQGVFFRSSTRAKADELGVNGYVRNLPDGRVEAVFEGSAKAVRTAVSWAHKGPKYAQVKSVDVHWEKPKDDFHGFKVIR